MRFLAACALLEERIFKRTRKFIWYSGHFVHVKIVGAAFDQRSIAPGAGSSLGIKGVRSVAVRPKDRANCELLKTVVSACRLIAGPFLVRE